MYYATSSETQHCLWIIVYILHLWKNTLKEKFLLHFINTGVMTTDINSLISGTNYPN